MDQPVIAVLYLNPTFACKGSLQLKEVHNKLYQNSSSCCGFIYCLFG